MEHQVLDFRHAVAAIGRRWWVLVTLVLLGSGAGATVILMSAPTYRATARVVLPPSTVDSRGIDLRDSKSEAYIASSPQVLAAAGKTMTPPVSAQALAGRVHARSITSQIEEVAADAPTRDEAARLANAVARAYIASNDSTASDTAGISTSLLNGQANGLRQQIQSLEAQIATDNATLKDLPPADAPRESSVIDSLRSQEASLTDQLITIQGRIADAQLNSELSRQGTRLLQPASAPTHPVQRSPSLILGAGALAGLIIGAIVALALEQGDRRLRGRDELAMAAAAPVVASLTVPTPARKQEWRDVLEQWEPSIVDNLALRQAFASLNLANGTPANLIVVTLAGDTTASLLALQLACYAAGHDTTTAYIFGSHHASNASLRAACLAAAAEGSLQRHGVVIYGAGGEEPDTLDGFDLSVTSIVADSGPLILPTWDRRSVTTLAVSSGAVTGDRLEAVAAASWEAGMPVIGVIVANPDASDRTTGRGDLPLALSAETPRVARAGARDDASGGAGDGAAVSAREARARAAEAAFASMRTAMAETGDGEAPVDAVAPVEAPADNANFDPQPVTMSVEAPADNANFDPQPVTMSVEASADNANSEAQAEAVSVGAPRDRSSQTPPATNRHPMPPKTRRPSARRRPAHSKRRDRRR